MEHFIEIMGAIIVAGVSITAYFFRKGGIYNPTPEIALQPPIIPNPPIMPPTPETLPVPPKTSEKRPLLEEFALCIRDFEGKPGDQNWRLNNPGNCRYNPTGYLPMYGKVGKSKNGFAIFASYELGWKYLLNMLRGQIRTHPNETVLTFMQRYAPVKDNNDPVAYSKYIAKRLGVDNLFLMRDLV